MNITSLTVAQEKQGYDWGSRAIIILYITKNLIPMNWERMDGLNLFNFAGLSLDFIDRSLDVIVQTNLIRDSKRVDGVERAISAGLNNLDSIRQLFICGEGEKAMQMLYFSYPSRASFGWKYKTSEEDHAKICQANKRMCVDLAPEIFRLIDPEWIRIIKS